MDAAGRWTIDELVDQVARALASGYGGQASGRVRDLPDRRGIRYYTTLGLVDRPSGWRGRTALYGERHLLQLVAIKRLQALGLTLAEVQRELAGATGATLRRLARLPAGTPANSMPEPAAGPAPGSAGALGDTGCHARTAGIGPETDARTNAKGAASGRRPAGRRFWATDGLDADLTSRGMRAPEAADLTADDLTGLVTDDLADRLGRPSRALGGEPGGRRGGAPRRGARQQAAGRQGTGRGEAGHTSHPGYTSHPGDVPGHGGDNGATGSDTAGAGQARAGAAMPAVPLDGVTLQGVGLAPGLALLVEHGAPLAPHEVAAVRAAAEPLVAAARRLGLGRRAEPGGGRPAEPTSGAGPRERPARQRPGTAAPASEPRPREGDE